MVSLKDAGKPSSQLKHISSHFYKLTMLSMRKSLDHLPSSTLDFKCSIPIERLQILSSLGSSEITDQFHLTQFPTIQRYFSYNFLAASRNYTASVAW